MINRTVCRIISSSLILASATLAAQQKSPASGEPVSISFRALTASGSPVIDLAASDIVLKVGGRDRAIRTFERLRLGEEALNAPALPPAFATNVPAATGPRDTIVMIDDASVPPGEERRIVSAMEQYLAALGPADRVGLITVQDRGLNVGLTNDRDRVRAGLKTTAGRASSVESSEDAACRTRRVIDAITSVAGTVPPSHAPVTVLMFTTGVSAPAVATVMSRSSSSAAAPSACEVQPRDFQQLERAISGSAMNLYVVAAALSTSTAMQQGLENLAGASGNPLMELVKSGDSDIARVARENSAWYRVSFVADASERNGDLQRVEVRSTRAGVETHARAQVLIPKPAASTQPAVAKDMLRDARVRGDFEFRASAYFSQEPGSDKVKVVVLIEPANSGDQFKAAVVGLYDAAGKLTVQGTAEAANLTRAPATMAVLANPGKYRLRVAAVDTMSRGGTVDMDVDVSLTKADPVQMGSLILGVADGGSFSGRLQFSNEPAAIGYLEVYGVPAGAELSAQLEVLTSATGAPIAAAPTKVLGEGADGRRVILGGVGIADLPAGDVLLRMVVSLDGKPLGRVTKTLHKATK